MTKYKVVIEFEMEGNILKGHKMKKAQTSKEPPIEAYLIVLKRLLLQAAGAVASAGIEADKVLNPKQN